MKRTLAALAVVGLLTTACGSDDDAGSEASATADAETASAPAAGDASDATGEAPPSTGASDDDTVVGTTDDGTGSADAATDAASTDDTAVSSVDTGDTIDDIGDDDVILVDSIDEIPEECIDLMRGFLSDLEPIVADIDLTQDPNAISDLIGDQFEDISTEFDTEFEAAGCYGYEFRDDQPGFEAMMDLAGESAPGVVPFLEWLYSGATGG